MAKIRILIYCLDSNGFSYTSRAIHIATHIVERIETVSMLLITDVPIIGRFKLPPNLDYVHLPGIMQDDNDNFQARHLNIALNNTLTLRHKITKSAIKTFLPHLIIIEGNPAVLPGEVGHTFGFVRERMPDTRIVWALPDTLGVPHTITENWRQQEVYKMLEKICDEIWVHGSQKIFDVGREYQFPDSLLQKVFYTGYIRAPHLTRRRSRRELAEMNLHSPFVLVTTGSGTDGFLLIDTYLQYLEGEESPPPFQSVIITGPMMPTHQKHMLLARAEKLPGVIFHRYTKNLLQYLQHAELVVCNGGFNLLCEILSYGKRSIFVPSHAPDNEHFYRSHIFSELGLVENILPQTLSPKTLGEKIRQAIPGKNRNGQHWRAPKIDQNGLTKIVQRVQQWINVFDPIDGAQ